MLPAGLPTVSNTAWEIGISTDKIHARGPVGLKALTSEKWIVFGDGQVRG